MSIRRLILPKTAADLLNPARIADLKSAVRILRAFQNLRVSLKTVGMTSTSSLQAAGRNALISLQATVATTGEVSLSCQSESGTATLCGYDEYAFPSIPPKKYKLQSLSGIFYGCRMTPGHACLTAFTTQTYRYDFTGITCRYHPETACSNTREADGIQYLISSGLMPCPLLTGGSSSPLTYNCTSADPNYPFNTGTETISTTRTAVTGVGNGLCVPDPSGGDDQVRVGTVTKQLSEEDTEDDAIARAVGTMIGTSCTAAKEPRGAGDFTFDFVVVAYDFNCSSLTRLSPYRITYSLLTETYGGGGGVTSTGHVDFIAQNSTQTVTGLVDCPSGYQVTISAPTIVPL